jgi:hypothetical protein
VTSVGIRTCRGGLGVVVVGGGVVVVVSVVVGGSVVVVVEVGPDSAGPADAATANAAASPIRAHAASRPPATARAPSFTYPV